MIAKCLWRRCAAVQWPAWVLAASIACSDRTDMTEVSQDPLADRPLFSLMGGCGVSYTATLTASDSELEQYGVTADTTAVQVCETWTGSDYQIQIAIGSSNDPELEAPDAAWTVVYANTVLEGYDRTAALQSAEYVGSSAFEYVNASSAEVQASYDDPYYGIYSAGGGGTGGGCETECLAANVQSNRGPRAGVAVEAPAGSGSPGLRHGVTRRGIRYLVNDLDEIAPAPGGNRRFRGKRGDTEVTVELERGSELLVSEDLASPGLRLRATHTWRRAGDGWVRNRSLYHGERLGQDGRWHRYQASVTLNRVQVRNTPSVTVGGTR